VGTFLSFDWPLKSDEIILVILLLKAYAYPTPDVPKSIPTTICGLSIRFILFFIASLLTSKSILA